ncbi:HET-domain-containing protein [Cubamyces sp. BRFM 1775]|nr:HET-domain-containing protein [Cubamyces sp. BRFM 1775]
MRLLSTQTGKFVENADPDRTCYAILSHVWEADGEQSYQQVLAIWRSAECEGAVSILDNPDLSPKIKGFCTIARKHGYIFGWIDSCCIDKTSSAELTEAINSMYQWYRKADVCYTYLSDVQDDPHSTPYRPSEHLRQRVLSARWHTRGWTLQELIAPENVLFLTQTWRVIGSKLGLASLLERATGVSVAILTGEAPVESASVACRMSWASKRKTTRIEDEAYSLLGIFGVFMPTIYGEGRNAFLRLEIIKTIPDQSIFAWGRQKEPESLDNLNRDLTKSYHWAKAPWWNPSGLLADSPRLFESAGNVVPMSATEFASALGGDVRPASLPDIQCNFTPEGAHIQLLWYPLHPMLASRLVSYGSSAPHTPPQPELLPDDPIRPRDTVQVLALLRCRNHSDGSILARLFGVSDRTLLSSGYILDPIHERAKLSVRGFANTHYHILRLLPACRPQNSDRAIFSRPTELHSKLSSMPLVVNPILLTLLEDGEYGGRHNGWSAASQVRLSPRCRDALCAMGLKEASRMYWQDRAASGGHPAHFHVGYQLLLEHRRAVLSPSSSLKWVLTSRIRIYLIRDAHFYTDISVRHQSVLTGPLESGNPRRKYSREFPYLETAPPVEQSDLASMITGTQQPRNPLDTAQCFEYPLPRHTGMPFSYLRISTRATTAGDDRPTGDGRSHPSMYEDRGRKCDIWLSVQCCGNDPRDELESWKLEDTFPKDTDEAPWAVLVPIQIQPQGYGGGPGNCKVAA